MFVRHPPAAVHRRGWDWGPVCPVQKSQHGRTHGKRHSSVFVDLRRHAEHDTYGDCLRRRRESGWSDNAVHHYAGLRLHFEIDDVVNVLEQGGLVVDRHDFRARQHARIAELFQQSDRGGDVAARTGFGRPVIVSPPVTAPAEAAAAVKAAPAPISDAMAKPPVVASRCRSTPA